MMNTTFNFIVATDNKSTYVYVSKAILLFGELKYFVFYKPKL